MRFPHKYISEYIYTDISMAVDSVIGKYYVEKSKSPTVSNRIHPQSNVQN